MAKTNEATLTDGRQIVIFNPNSERMLEIVNKMLELLQKETENPAEAMVACEIAADFFKSEFEVQQVGTVAPSRMQ